MDGANALYRGIMEIITQENFNEVVNTFDRVVVDIYADWCGPCKMIAPVLEQLSTELPNVKFVKIDADAEVNKDLLGTLGVMSIPTLLLLKNGELVQKLVGFQSKPNLEAKIKLL